MGRLYYFPRKKQFVTYLELDYEGTQDCLVVYLLTVALWGWIILGFLVNEMSVLVNVPVGYFISQYF